MLTVTEMLRKKKVVGKFVEFYGSGLSTLSLADRATIANMAPEYGATMGFFPVDAETLKYLRLTRTRRAAGRSSSRRTRKAQGLFRTDDTPDPVFTDTLELDLGTVEPSLAGPKRPQDRVPLKLAKQMFREALHGRSREARHARRRSRQRSRRLQRRGVAASCRRRSVVATDRGRAGAPSTAACQSR